MTQDERGVAVISGASSGFGERIAQVLAQQGYSVVALARRVDRLKALAEQDATGAILPVVADVRDREGLARAFDELPPDFRDISVLINNAGLSRGSARCSRAATRPGAK